MFTLMDKEVIVVALGGAAGSVSRFLLSFSVQRFFPYAQFPWGILVCNILGCFLIGILFGVFELKLSVDPIWRAGLIIGVLGGFTTFSSFSLDTFHFLHQGEILLGILNVLLSIISCLLATAFGYGLVYMI